MDQVRIIVACAALFVMPGVSVYGQYQGEILNRTPEGVEVRFSQNPEATRPVRATVYRVDRKIHLPGTQETIVKEWKRVGEILCLPPFGETVKGTILAEDEPQAIDRGCVIQFLPNRPPVVTGFTGPAGGVTMGNKVLIAVNVTDPEGDGVNLHWGADSGRWLQATSRAPYNFYLAGMEEGEVQLTLRAVDVFGAVTESSTTLTVGPDRGKDLYQYKYSLLDKTLSPAGITDALQDSSGRFYVLEKGELTLFSRHGFRQSAIQNIFQDGARLRVDRQGFLYVLDFQRKTVFKINPDGKLIGTLKDQSDQGDTVKMLNPVDFTLRRDGAVYVLDQDLCRVLVFSPEGLLTGAIGARGSGAGQFLRPVAVAIDDNDLLYVVDQGDLRLKIFGRSGSMIRTVPLSERFIYTSLVLDPVQNQGYLVGNLTGRTANRPDGYVTVWDLTSDALGRSAPIQGAEGIGVRSASLDLEGNLIVNTERKGPVLRVTPGGRLLGRFLEEEPQKDTLLKTGPYGAIYFQSGRAVKRLGYEGWVESLFENDGIIQAMAVDADENLFLVNRGEDKIKMYNTQGQHMKDIRTLLGPRDRILGMGVDDQARIHLLVSPALVKIFSRETGAVEKTVDLATLPVGSGGQTVRIATPIAYHVGRDGTNYAVERSNRALFVYRGDFSDNQVITGQFSKISDLAVDGLGNIYILDDSRRVVYKYAAGGQLKREIDLKDQVRRPKVLSTFGDGMLVVFDDANRSLRFFQ